MSEPATIDGLVRRTVDARPNEEALADAPNRATLDGGLPQRLTWTEVDARIDGAVAELRAAGVGLGDSVRVQLASVVKLPITLLACFRMGAVAVPFPVQHRAHELRHGFALAGFKVFVTTDRTVRPDQFAAAAEALGPQVAILTPATESGPPLKPLAITPDTAATACWTSGTTSTPNGVPAPTPHSPTS